MVTEWFDGRLYSALCRNGGWMKVDDLIQATVDLEVEYGEVNVWWGPLVRVLCGKRALRWCLTPSYSRFEQAVGLHVLRGNVIVRDIEGMSAVVEADEDPEMARVELKAKRTLEETFNLIGQYNSPKGRRSRFKLVPNGSK